MRLEHVKLDMHTRYIPIIGYPMDHSSASYVYNYLFGCRNLNAIMWPLELEKGRLPEFMAARNLFGIDKFTLTMPHKADIIPLLDRVEESARLFGSVNVVWTEEGQAHGCSCDGLGCVSALTGAGVQLAGRRVMILGAGSISGILGYEFARHGAKEIVLLNRTLKNAQRIAQVLDEHTRVQASGRPMEPQALKEEAARADLVVQCSALGMHGYGADYEDLEFLDALRPGVPVMEAIVNPPLTSFARRAQAYGHPVVPGMDMLLGQMGAIFECWFSIELTQQEKEGAKRVLREHFGL